MADDLSPGSGGGEPGWQPPCWHTLPLVLLSLAICV